MCWRIEIYIFEYQYNHNIIMHLRSEHIFLLVQNAVNIHFKSLVYVEQLVAVYK